MGIVKLPVDENGVIEGANGVVKLAGPEVGLPQVIPGHRRIRVLVGEAAEELQVAFQPLAHFQTVQQLLHGHLVVGVEAQALLVVLGGTLELLPALVSQPQVEEDVVAVLGALHGLQEEGYGLGKLALLGGNNAPGYGHVGVVGVEVGHVLNLGAGGSIFAFHGQHLGAVDEQLRAERILGNGRFTGLEGFFVLRVGRIMVDDVLKIGQIKKHGFVAGYHVLKSTHGGQHFFPVFKVLVHSHASAISTSPPKRQTSWVNGRVFGSESAPPIIYNNHTGGEMVRW